MTAAWLHMPRGTLCSSSAGAGPGLPNPYPSRRSAGPGSSGRWGFFRLTEFPVDAAVGALERITNDAWTEPQGAFLGATEATAPRQTRLPVHGATLPFWRGCCVTALCGIRVRTMPALWRALVRVPFALYGFTEPVPPAGELSGSDRATRCPTEELRDGLWWVARRASSQRLNSCAQVAILDRERKCLPVRAGG
jgi:hypothetical protein